MKKTKEKITKQNIENLILGTRHNYDENPEKHMKITASDLGFTKEEIAIMERLYIK